MRSINRDGWPLQQQERLVVLAELKASGRAGLI